MKRLFLLCCLIYPILCCCQKHKPAAGEQIIFERMAYIYHLKDTINKDVWKGFTVKQYDVPLIYYTDTSSYIANPTSKFLKLFTTQLVFQNGAIKVYKTVHRIDSIPFHMSTGYETGDSATEYNYYSPFMGCSSFEETKKTIPDVLSVEEWATMVIHEYFHGFQFKHKPLLDYSAQNFLYVGSDSLKRMYKHNARFKEKIDQENDLLLVALNTPNDSVQSQSIKAFFALRDERRLQANQQLHFDVKKYEEFYETLEGTARYTEYGLYQKFAAMKPDAALQKVDTFYHSYKRFKNYSIIPDKWLYLTSHTSYVYAIGFNMARLLDKMGVAYKSTLFDAGFSLEEILRKQ